MRSGWLVLAFALGTGCYRDSPVVVEPPAPPAPRRLDPLPLVAPFLVTGSELGDEGAVERITHRTRLGRLGQVSFRLDRDPIAMAEGGANEWTFDRIYPVIDRTETRVRIVIADNATLYALWVQASDTRHTVLAPVRLVPTATTRYQPIAAGAWLQPGARVTVGPAGRRRHVQLTDDRIEIAGFVDGRLIGNVWVERTHAAKSLSWDGLAEPWVKHPPDDVAVVVIAGTRIHVAPDDASTVIATAKRHVPATRLGRTGPWTEIEIARSYATVRGFARIPANTEEAGRVVVTDTHTIINMPGARFPIQVGSGTCFYDEVKGIPIGVQLEPATRYASRTAEPDWLEILHQTPWGDVSIYAHAVNPDPKQPEWHSCARDGR